MGNNIFTIEGDTDEEEDLDLDEMDIKELEAMLDENLPDDLKETKRPQYEERFKTVMEGGCFLGLFV